jgi:asparagine synthase (glutamine-hydrolysing)
MCGIGGILYFDKERSVETAILKKMSDVIHHRGPDDEGVYTDRNAGLCFRRLSIIDLATGHQPMSDSTSGLTIVFNGEIYNFLELREHLLAKGYSFRTFTDTEVILYLYEEYGTECLQYLRGMFAFAIWDSYNRQMFCARDRFGIKPFYYYTDKQKLVFGSEIKVIMNAGEIDSTLSYEALDSYLAFSYISGDLSIYKSIKKLLPGHYLMISLRDKPEIETHKYWDIKFEPDSTKSEEYWIEEIKNCLNETVKLHMISDVPFGAFLSGGVDSGAIVSFMAKNSHLPVKTFSIGFADKEYNELPNARLVAQKYGCEHHEAIIEPESISILPKIVGCFDEPFADSSAVATYFVSKIARENVTVALSGDGGDELFAGYNHYTYLKKLYSFPFHFSSPFYSRIIWGGLHGLLPHNMKGSKASYLFSTGKDNLSAYLYNYSLNDRKKMFLNDHSALKLSNGSELYKVGILKKGKNHDFVSNMQYLDLQTFMVDSILTKVDRTSMLNSLEVRVPLLDHKFAELTFKIPSDLKLKGAEQKFIFKKAVKDLLPAGVLSGSKKGFSIPLYQWFRNDLNEYVHDTLLSADPRISAFLDKKIIRKMVMNVLAQDKKIDTQIWSLICFEEWLKQNRNLTLVG